jgi:hypothetical protein
VSNGNPPEMLCKVCRAVGCCSLEDAGVAAEVLHPPVTLDIEAVTTLTRQLDAFRTSAAGAFAAGSAPPLLEQLHVTADGGRLISGTLVHPDGNSVTVHLEGSIGPVPYNLDLTVSADLAAREITVRLKIEQPLQFDHTWKYKMGGVVVHPAGQVMASSLDLVRDGAITMQGLNGWCVLNCAGRVLMPILVGCLPTLPTGGVPAYLACVAGKLGTAAATIARCIIDKCLG